MLENPGTSSEKKGKQVNEEGYYGKVTLKMLNESIDIADTGLRQKMMEDPSVFNTVIKSLQKITQSFSNREKQKLPYVTKDLNAEKRNSEIIAKLQSMNLIQSEKIVELRKTAQKISDDLKIPISNEMMSKENLMIWFSDNMAKIESHYLK
ncbi:hypothetical protein TVAG_293410 [Trichomonas vaginalis G3]|uniref:Uncharacterized protein n=1 Tax=Trichomonas vaginalis (strain ATCC PRA-98 / G3) TaxID=412133 RepID=A2FCL4_TRIV3|nr:hypothetical protein TVAGG3_0378860 [Trichomonas vaginalis G3]EAX97336.1 hypothetical protein TVAG_293410 [Trichomonas vaginalis G3]KAI5533124.1 hypothetical protein TVAGG3_0378860 [Trichomonas vaginalis G3]|eukprot:XP_001310266.1 hypothetical protein [Trichomonas vaginalis G3]